MKIGIFGAGAVGSHMAAKLAHAGAQVSVVARAAHVAAIRAHGLRFDGPDESFTVNLNAVSDARELGPQDLLITTVKAHALPQSVDSILPLLAAHTPIVYALNGIPWWYFHGHGGAHDGHRLERLDPGDKLWNRLGVDRAIGCVVYSSNELTAPGVVSNNSPDNHYYFGEPDRQRGRSARLAEIGDALSGISKLTLSEDIRGAVWSKLVQNLATSQLCCLTHSKVCDVVAQPALRDTLIALIDEGTQVAGALGIDVDTPIGPRLARMAKINHRPSMLQDLEAGRPMEIAAQIVAVRDLARLLGTATPVLDLLSPVLEQRARQAGLV